MQYVYVAPVVGMSLTIIRLIQRFFIMGKLIKSGEGMDE
jgi:hypothetical protein